MQKANFRLSITDYVAYNQRLCARKIGLILAVSIGVIAVFFIVTEGAEGIPAILSGAFAGLAVFALYVFVIVPRSTRAIYYEQVSMSEERELSVDAQGVEFTQPSGNFRTGWPNIVQWDETPRLIILFINRAMFIPITKSDIGIEMSRVIKERLVESGLTKPMRGRSAR